MSLLEEAGCSRTSPISPPEKELLLGLIESEKVLQSFKTDCRILLQKREAWARITKNFNAHSTGPMRTEQQLKKVWERLKVKAKKNVAERKRELYKTGGGAPPAEVPPECEKVITLLGNDFEDLGSNFDSDLMPSQAKSHRHGRLRFTSSLIVREDSQILYQFVDPPRTLENEGDVSLPPEANKEAGETSQKMVPACPGSSKKRRQQSKWHEKENYNAATEISQSSFIIEEQKRLLEKKQKLMDLHLKHMEVRIAEAESRKAEADIKVAEALARKAEAEERRAEAAERREEARICKEIAKREYDKSNKF